MGRWPYNVTGILVQNADTNHNDKKEMFTTWKSIISTLMATTEWTTFKQSVSLAINN